MFLSPLGLRSLGRESSSPDFEPNYWIDLVICSDRFIIINWQRHKAKKKCRHPKYLLKMKIKKINIYMGKEIPGNDKRSTPT